MADFSSLKHNLASIKYHKLDTASYHLGISRSFKRESSCGKILRKIWLCTGWLILLCLLAAGALCVYQYVTKNLLDKDDSNPAVQANQCSIDENNRFDCWPEKNGANQQVCEERGCCWAPASKPNTIPWCFFPSNYNGYNATDVKATSTGIDATLVRSTDSFFPPDVKTLKLAVEFQSDTRLRIKIYDPASARYEVPLDVPTGSNAQSPLYSVTVEKTPFNIVVKRKSTGATLFDTTSTAPLIFADQYLQIATQLSTKYLYGLGEHRGTFLQNLTTWRRLVFWNRDDVPKVDNNGYGTHPFFLNLESEGGPNDAHGVFLLNSNGGEVALQPFGGSDRGAVTYRFLGGILDFFIVMGPDPISVVNQYTDIIGRPYMPPFWSLGFHLCKWGYNSSNTLQEVIQRNREAQIPYVAFQPYGPNQAGAVTYRMLGGILDFFIVLDSEPLSVVSQYTEIIGRPYMPPFWSLGYHICKYGINSSADLQNMINRNRAAQIPYDVQWSDIDYMIDHRDWTYDKTRYKGLPDIVKDLHDNQQRYIIMADPAISSEQPAGTYPPFDDGVQMDIFVKNSSGGILIGKVWPGLTAFPDFFHPKAPDYWYKSAKAFHDQISFDGLWIDMNEPSSFVDGSASGCPASSLNNPPFVPETIDGGSLMAKTVCPSAKHVISSHYNMHNMYGWSQANVTRRVLDTLYQNKRSPIISRSSFPGTGKNAGHWLGDNESTYPDLYYSIPGILNFNLYGIPQIGADICGFRGVTTPEMCTRWQQLGAFYPFMRNHASIDSPAQDPGTFKSPYVDYIRSAIQLRYRLLAVLYTAFFKAHTEGLPIVRPLFYLYPGTEAIDKQFMWNDQLLVSPVLDQGATSVQAYIPNDVYYDFFNGSMLMQKGQVIQLDANLDRINVHIRGGSILPLLPPAQRTDISRQRMFELFVALDANGKASGELFWDDGENIDSITAGIYSHILFNQTTATTLTSTVIKAGYKPAQGVKLEVIIFYGVSQKPTRVTVNGQSAAFSYDGEVKALAVTDLDVDLLTPLSVVLQ